MADLSRSPLGKYLDAAYPATHFLGYRPQNGSKSALFTGSFWASFPRRPNAIRKAELIIHSFIAAFLGITFIELMVRGAGFVREHVPLAIGSMGAVAVLIYGSYTSPLAQPKAVILGNFVSAFVGVCMAKLFSLSTVFQLGTADGIAWIAGALAVGLSIGAMQLFDIVHPPAGATALLAVVLPQTEELGWFYLPLVLSSTLVLVGWSLLINNVGTRRYPQFWISPDAWMPPPVEKVADPDPVQCLQIDELGIIFDKLEQNLRSTTGVLQNRKILSQAENVIELLRERIDPGHA